MGIKHNVCTMLSEGLGIWLRYVSPKLLANRVDTFKHNVMFARQGTQTTSTTTTDMQLRVINTVPGINACALAPSGSVLTEVRDTFKVTISPGEFPDFRGFPEH